MSIATKFALEAAAYLNKEEWFLGIVEKFKPVLAARPLDRQRIISENKIVEAIKEETGVTLRFTFSNSPMVNVGIAIPDYSANHVFKTKLTKLAARESRWLFERGNVEHIFGKVDRNTGKISGTLSEYPRVCIITEGAISKLEPEELVAVIIGHEIGHIFSYMENLNRTVAANIILEASVKDLKGTNPINVNYSIVANLQDRLKIKFKEDIKALSQERDTEKLRTIVITETIREIYGNRYESSLYDHTTFEAASDQFASRMGLGIYLARAINKMELSGNRLISKRAQSYALLAATTAAIIFKPLIGAWYLGTQFALMGLSLLDSNFHPELNNYDNPMDRLSRLRLDMIGRLKADKSGGDPATVALVKDIDEIEHMVKQHKEGFSVFLSLANLIWLPFRRKKDLKEREQYLEKLANNDLYVSAFKLRQVGKESFEDIAANADYVSPIDILACDRSYRQKITMLVEQSQRAEKEMLVSEKNFAKLEILKDLVITKCSQDDYDDGVQLLYLRFGDDWLSLRIELRYEDSTVHEGWRDFVENNDVSPSAKAYLANCLSREVLKLSGELLK